MFVRYSVPRIAYINKLDKPTASISGTLSSMKKRLSVEPLLTQIPLGGEGKLFFGIVDLGEHLISQNSTSKIRLKQFTYI